MKDPESALMLLYIDLFEETIQVRARLTPFLTISTAKKTMTFLDSTGSQVAKIMIAGSDKK